MMIVGPNLRAVYGEDHDRGEMLVPLPAVAVIIGEEIGPRHADFLHFVREKAAEFRSETVTTE